jgi:hypothetical protein
MREQKLSEGQGLSASRSECGMPAFSHPGCLRMAKSRVPGVTEGCIFFVPSCRFGLASFDLLLRAG